MPPAGLEPGPTETRPAGTWPAGAAGGWGLAGCPACPLRTSVPGVARRSGTVRRRGSRPGGRASLCRALRGRRRAPSRRSAGGTRTPAPARQDSSGDQQEQRGRAEGGGQVEVEIRVLRIHTGGHGVRIRVEGQAPLPQERNAESDEQDASDPAGCQGPVPPADDNLGDAGHIGRARRPPGTTGRRFRAA